MKRIYAVILGVACLMFVGCAGKNYVHHENVAGFNVIQGGRTGAFGTDNSFVYIAPVKEQVSAAPMSASPKVVTTLEKRPVKIKTEKSYTRSSTSWTGCPDKTPNRNAKNVQREEFSETWKDEVVGEESTETVSAPVSVPAVVQAPTVFWAGGNASTGNLAMPAGLIAGGMIGGAAVLRPNSSNVEANSNSEINHSGNSGGDHDDHGHK